MPKGVYERRFNSYSHCRSSDLIAAFWARIDRVNGPIHPVCGQCWMYLGNPSQRYGHFKDVFAHRFVWELVNGPIPEGMLVLHECDNGKCVNPGHLFLGTPQDNMDDKMSKGRQGDSGTKTPPHGSLNGRAKLTEEIVTQIRELKRSGWTVKEIIAHLSIDVAEGTVRSAISGKTWRTI